MEKSMDIEREGKKLILAASFIKTRKLESIAMDMAERMQTEALKKGYHIFATVVDRDGNRDIDREQLDEIYDLMNHKSFHDLFVRSMDDIATSWEDQLAFARYADDHKVNIHIVDVTPEPEMEVWDGGAGC